jgi:N-acetylmuramoyl-L-alanine amidase
VACRARASGFDAGLREGEGLVAARARPEADGLPESPARAEAWALADSIKARAVREGVDDNVAGEEAIGRSVRSEAAEQTHSPRVTQIEWWPGREAARVVIALDRPTAYRIGDEVAAGIDPRTFLDFDGVELGPIQNDVLTQGIVTHIHAETTTTGSRIWLDLDGHAWRRVFEMREPYRVVVDVARRPPGVQGAGPRTVSRVVLDPGHGGSDRGARGPSGLQEKDVVLDIAHRVAPVLAAQGIQVVLTRDDDTFVSLEERTARANAFGADLFVSLHCNASEGRGRRGVESYVLDTNRDEVAARVAAFENATTQTASTELASILGGLRMADGGRSSKRLAQLLLRASTTAVQTKYGDAVDGGVHAAGFYVLVGARMPAVLFEASYISNATDEQRLGSEEYRQLLADAIANALRAYREGR